MGKFEIKVNNTSSLLTLWYGIGLPLESDNATEQCQQHDDEKYMFIFTCFSSYSREETKRKDSDVDFEASRRST